jgi:hypothetical protein
MSAQYVDTCMSCYLQASYSSETSTLLMCTPTGQTLDEAVEELLSDLNSGCNTDMPDDEDVPDFEIGKALRAALDGVDLRHISDDGDRITAEEFEAAYPDEFPDEYPSVYVVLRWRKLPTLQLDVRIDDCDVTLDALARHFYHLEGLAEEAKRRRHPHNEAKLRQQMRRCTELRQQLAELDYDAC